MMSNRDDVILYDVDYCVDCGFERPVSEMETKRRKCPNCDKPLIRLVRVKKI